MKIIFIRDAIEMNLRIFLVHLFLIINALSLFAVDAEHAPKDEFKLHIYCAVAPRKGNGIIVFAKEEERQKALINRAEINKDLEKYCPGSGDIILRIPKRIARAGQAGKNEREPFLVSCSQVPACISETMLTEVLRGYCSPCSIIFFRHDHNFIWLHAYDRVPDLIMDPFAFQLPQPERNRLLQAISCFEMSGFDIINLKESQIDPDKFSATWAAFEDKNNLKTRKTEWMREQENNMYAVCNAVEMVNPTLTEPKLLSSGQVFVSVTCDSLLQAFSSHRDIQKLGWEWERQKIMSEVEANFEPSKIVVGDETCRGYLFFSNRNFRFLASPVSEEKWQLVYDIVSSQRIVKLKCRIAQTIHVHEVVIFGSPTIKDLVDALNLYFPDDEAIFLNKDLESDAQLTEFIESGLEVEMNSGIRIE